MLCFSALLTVLRYLLLLPLVAILVSSSEVVELTDFTFDKTVLAPDAGVWFIRFYAPWCGHCKALEPVWKEAAEKLKGQVHFGDVDATSEFGLAQRFSIRGYPTLYLFSEGNYYAFDGSRKVESLEDFSLHLFHTKPAIPVPRMPLRIFALAEKYTSKANIYLYQHPLLTSIILFCIGLIFGICITLLTIEIIYSYRHPEIQENESESPLEEEESSIQEENDQDSQEEEEAEKAE